LEIDMKFREIFYAVATTAVFLLLFMWWGASKTPCHAGYFAVAVPMQGTVCVAGYKWPAPDINQ
jgi:hypothetical protein